jgi:hypothetical protein
MTSTTTATNADSPLLGQLAWLWGVGGFTLLLVFAIARLVPLAAASTAYPWHAGHVVLLLVNVAVMAWFEGYRGFQRSYSPRLAARALHLRRHATPLKAALAPLLCMGFLWAPRRRVVAAWLLTLGIVAVVLLYRLLPQPWRGILDAGVVVGLCWGLVATLGSALHALRHGPAVDAELR